MPTRSKARKTPKMKSKKPVRRATRAITKKKKTTVKKRMMTKAPKIKIVGRIIHYYDRIQVAILELAAPLRVGDMVKIKDKTQEFVQNVDSLQIEHLSVESAKKKQVVGMKVMMPVHEGALVMPA